jgi:hypothetical protein
MTTALDIITSALQRTGIYAPGEPLTDADAERGLIVLNDMMDGWAASYVLVWQLTPLVLTLTTGAVSYTLGSRPPRILYGPGAASATLLAVTLAADVVSEVEWQAIYATATVAAGAPAKVFYSPAWPYGIVYFTPAPSAAATLTVSQYQILAAFATLSAAYALAPGSDEALRSNLCIACKAYWTAAKIDETIVETAAQTRKFLALQTLNSRAVPMRLSGAPPRQPQ